MMEQRHLTDNEFELLWQEASARGAGKRLAGEYPAWRRARRRTLGVLAMLVVVVAVAVPWLTYQPSHDEYVCVYCNRPNTTDAQWASLASEMLLL